VEGNRTGETRLIRPRQRKGGIRGRGRRERRGRRRRGRRHQRRRRRGGRGKWRERWKERWREDERGGGRGGGRMREVEGEVEGGGGRGGGRWREGKYPLEEPARSLSLMIWRATSLAFSRRPVSFMPIICKASSSS